MIEDHVNKISGLAGLWCQRKSIPIRDGVFLFFKQKAAYDVLRSLVGSEMCIRDRIASRYSPPFGSSFASRRLCTPGDILIAKKVTFWTCLLYTSDAADDLLCVDLGGRRLIKKKKTTNMYKTSDDTST